MGIYDGNVKGFNPAPGAQMPQKYPTTGEAYARYGEPPEGWVYSPADDTYRRSPEYREQLQRYEEEAGLREKQPKQPSLTDTLLPIAGTAGAIYAGKGIGQALYDKGAGLLGSGAAEAPAIAEGATGAGSGLLGAGAPSAGIDAAGLGNIGGAAPGVLPDATAAAAQGASNPGLLSGFGNMAGSLETAGPLAAIVASTYLGGKSALNMLKGKNDKSAQGYLGRGLLGVATGGLSELARPFLMHKSTRDRQKDVTNRLLEESGNDAVAQQYWQGMREQFKEAPPDPSKPFFGGKYGSFDEYKAGGLDAVDLSGVQGNADALGAKEWANLTQDQRVKATQALIDADQYYSSDGGVKVRDKAEAKKIIDAALAPPAPKKAGLLGASQNLVKDDRITPVTAQQNRPGLLGAK